MQILTWFSSFVFKKITVWFKKAALQKNFVVVEEERLDGIDVDDAENLEDSPRFLFIDEESESLIVVNDGRELTRNKNQKKKSGISQ